MIGAFSSALSTALGDFVTSITTGIQDNLTVVLPITLGVAGIFLLWRVVSGFLHGR